MIEGKDADAIGADDFLEGVDHRLGERVGAIELRLIQLAVMFAYQVGEQVNVRYDPLNPNTAQIDSFFERWIFPIIIIPTMILAAAILNFFMIRAWRRGEYIGE